MTKVIIKEGSETSFGMGINPDLLIGDVKVGGAAARAGVCDGMQIVSVMGERVTERQRVLVILKSLPPKAPLTIELRRIGSQQKPQQPSRPRRWRAGWPWRCDRHCCQVFRLAGLVRAEHDALRCCAAGLFSEKAMRFRFRERTFFGSINLVLTVAR